MTDELYSRQLILPQIGSAGQARISATRIVILGVGSLGTASAEALARLGVGYLRLVDRDYVSESNLARSALFTQKDVSESNPKAVGAATHLAEIGMGGTYEPQVSDINPQTVEALIKDMDLVIDGTDNFAVRYLINEACHALGKTWIHGAGLGLNGAAMVIKPEGPCLRCLIPNVPEPGSYPTCASAGVLGLTTQMVANLQVVEALKYILDIGKGSGSYVSLDILNHEIDAITVEKDPECKTCSLEQYEFLGKPASTLATELCGRDEFQVSILGKHCIDLQVAANKLRERGSVTVSPFLLSFTRENLRFKLFADGRAMIKGAATPEAALQIYSDYVGL
ncbi:molybdopterin biosynthesis protein MoeB [Betaproteobacteria bacterium]|nr:molybdopterin biosynthesis protein MoeB [Betaproteobacteria bacterium]